MNIEDRLTSLIGSVEHGRVERAIGLAVLFVVGVAGCTRHNPLACCVAADDCTAIGASAPEPCPNGLACVQNECQQPPDAAIDAMIDASTMCTTDMNCGGATPYCSRDHVCVECVMSSECPASAPACDPSTLSCRGCIADSECASYICDQSSGTCADSSLILYASPIGTDTASCTQAAPCSIVHAFALAGSSRNTISVAPGSYTASITVANKTVNVHGYAATLNASPSAHALTVSDGATVRVYGLAIIDTNSGTAGIDCEPTSGTIAPTLVLDQVSVQSAGTTLNTNPCAATISRSRLHVTDPTFNVLVGYAGANISIDRTLLDGGDGLISAGAGTAVNVTNSVIANQTGTDGALSETIFGGPAGSMTISFSTIINSIVKCATGVPVCAGGTNAGACIDNSIVFNSSSGAPSDTVTGSACRATYSIVSPQSSSITGSSNKLGTSTTWSVSWTRCQTVI